VNDRLSQSTKDARRATLRHPLLWAVMVGASLPWSAGSAQPGNYHGAGGHALCGPPFGSVEVIVDGDAPMPPA